MQQNLEQNVLRPVKCLMASPSTILVFAKMAYADIIKGDTWLVTEKGKNFAFISKE